MTTLAFDPSLSCTGWALLREDGPKITLIEFGDFTHPPDQSIATRLRSLHAAAAKLILDTLPDHIAIEFPREGFVAAKRSSASLPAYGMAVGVVLAAALAAPGVKIVPVPADEWGRFIPRGGTNEMKTNRINAVRLYLGVDLLKTYKSKVRASGVADAALVGRYAITKVQRDGIRAA